MTEEDTNKIIEILLILVIPVSFKKSFNYGLSIFFRWQIAQGIYLVFKDLGWWLKCECIIVSFLSRAGNGHGETHANGYFEVV